MAVVRFFEGMSLDFIPPVKVTRTIPESYLRNSLSQLAKDYLELAELQGTDIQHLQIPASQVLSDLAAIIARP